MFHSILVPIDLEHDNPGSRALPKAAALIDKHGSKVTLLNVLAPIPAVVAQNLPEDYEAQHKKESEAELEALAKRYMNTDNVSVMVRHGGVYPEILEAASKLDVDLILMHSHKPGLSDYLLGSNAARVVRHSGCSVLVLR
ncbi:MAG: universal stress protein UspA [Hyphomicrobiales bacterium]|nr:MAG: universal stress protein UspA [Hyphomicrobiales bacterium]